ncbi:MAG: PhoH family protein [Kofleriaceae bacterium]|nr:PhoH family protein [Kofleriaceae bacterium]MCL4224077.1 PhoH family protein [Myxococcales bacterium]
MLRRDKLAFDDPEALQALCGTNNTRLKLIERTAGAQLHLRGNEITIEGDDASTAVVRSALEQLYGFARKGKHLASDDVVRAVKVLAADASAELAPIFSDTVLVPRGGRPIAAKGVAQKQYIDLVRGNDVVFGVGPAGTGKTYLAMALAVRALLDKTIRRIVLTRPAVEAGERLGFLPGTLEEKVNPYLRPLYDALHDMLDPEKVQRLMADDVIEVAPLAFMRGRTLNDAFVILDEAQNTTVEQMKMFLTRLGFGSKAVITGDPSQTDLPRGQRSGLRDALDLLDGIRGIGVARFSDADVVRHPLVAAIIRAYDGRDRARSQEREARDAREAREERDELLAGDARAAAGAGPGTAAGDDVGPAAAAGDPPPV